MRISKSNIALRVLASISFGALLAGASLPALAFDPTGNDARSSSRDIEADKGPLDLFKFGFRAYKKGEKEQAVEAYRSAAEQGHRGARWALANMYAFGDGVTEDNYEAFKNYQKIARQGVEPGSHDVGYFINAIMALADYYQRGIPNSPVEIDYEAARQLYFQAASAFGVPEAQYRLGQMILDGKGGGTNVRQAKKWLNRARSSGHPLAAALYGHVIFEEGDAVKGLALITAAHERAAPHHKDWVRSLQEQALSVSEEADRRTAIAVAQDMLAKGMY